VCSASSPKRSSVNQACRDRLEKYFEKRGQTLGEGLDDGDCLYDAILKGGLNQLIQSKYKFQHYPESMVVKDYHLEVKDLRMVLKDYFEHLDSDNLEKVREVHRNIGHSDPFEIYLKNLETTFAEYKEATDRKQQIGLPEWGDHRLEGRLLAELFQFKLIVYELGYQEDVKKLKEKIKANEPLNDKTDFWTDKFSYGPSKASVVKIVLFPGHYDPVLPIENENMDLQS
jgi:hypothetical protein